MDKLLDRSILRAIIVASVAGGTIITSQAIRMRILEKQLRTMTLYNEIHMRAWHRTMDLLPEEQFAEMTDEAMNDLKFHFVTKNI